MQAEHRVALATDPATAVAMLARAAESWGGSWQADESQADECRGGRLQLPVSAGVRHGWVTGRVSVEDDDDSVRLSFRVEASRYHLQSTVVLVLSLAGAGALATVVAPFVPRLFPLVPLGIMLSLGGWLFIVARLRNSGPEEFFETLALEAEREALTAGAEAEVE